MLKNSTEGNNCDIEDGNVDNHETASGKSFRCEQCNKCFKRRSNLRQHKRTHSGEKPFKCNFCFKCFSHKGHLNEHKRIHTGEKPFSCNQCDKRFNRNGLLKQHLKMHTRQQYIKVTQCNQLLSDQGHTQILTNIHLEKETFNENHKKAFHGMENLPQPTASSERHTLLNCDQDDEFESGELSFEKEVERTNLTGEPCKYTSEKF